jgi:Flavin reductase like domain
MRDQVFRDLMAAVCAPVTVVTTMGVTSTGEAGPHGATVSAFASLSLRPPLVYGHRTFGTHSRFDRRPRRPIHDTIAACAR